MEARILLDTGRRAEAAEILREALAICREAGTQFCGPKAASALSRAVGHPEERASLLADGKEMLEQGSVGHNHLWFYRDAIEALLSAGDGEGALEFVRALENYTRAEPLPWSGLFATRGRLLACVLRGSINEDMRDELVRLRTAFHEARVTAFLPPIEAALAI
jgi:hypothetical protein